METNSIYRTARNRDEWRKEWSDRQCGLPTQKNDVPDDHPGDADEKKKKFRVINRLDTYVVRH